MDTGLATGDKTTNVKKNEPIKDCKKSKRACQYKSTFIVEKIKFSSTLRSFRADFGVAYCIE